MKIAFTGVELPEGKVKFLDKDLQALEAKDNPKKVVPFFAEFVGEDFVHADVVVVLKENILDLLIYDIEKMESRLGRATDEKERALLEKCQSLLEEEKALCDEEFTEEERTILKEIAPFSYKPVVQLEGHTEVNDVIQMALDKAKFMFFYTTGPKESHAWLVRKGSDIVECAGAIHSDLARGFIKGDVVSMEDYLKCHNFKDCQSKGVAKVVDRGYEVQPAEIIEIRFNV